MAVSRLARQVLACFVDDRSRKRLRTLWSRVLPTSRHQLIDTDESEGYAAFFRPWQHRPSPKGSRCTSVVEGLNNTWRNRRAGLVRRTMCTRDELDLVRRLRLVFDQPNHRCRRRVEHLGWHKLSTP